jgi:hypothetical protein
MKIYKCTLILNAESGWQGRIQEIEANRTAKSYVFPGSRVPIERIGQIFEMFRHRVDWYQRSMYVPESARIQDAFERMRQDIEKQRSKDLAVVAQIQMFVKQNDGKMTERNIELLLEEDRARQAGEKSAREAAVAGVLPL